MTNQNAEEEISICIVLERVFNDCDPSYVLLNYKLIRGLEKYNKLINKRF